MATEKQNLRPRNDPAALNRLAARLNEALDDLGIPRKGEGRITQTAKLFGVSQRACRRWLDAVGFPSQREYQAIADTLEVRVEWLFFGLGPKSDKLIKTGSNQEQILQTLDNLLAQAVSKHNIRLSLKARQNLSTYLSSYISKLQIR